MNKIKVSIITVCFNSEKTIKRTVESVLHQTYQNIEYIIVDGLSKDRTNNILSNYKEAFREKGIEYIIISEKDRGIYDAMNKGILKSSGEIIGIINSDDWYEFNAVERMLGVYHESLFDMFYADIRVITRKKQMIKHSSQLKGVISTRKWNHPTTFIKKEIYKNYQYKLESIYDDWDLILRIKKAGYKIVVLNEVLANFRMGGVSNTKSLSIAMQRSLERFRIYRNNGYSRFYFIECIGMEIFKCFFA